MSRNYKTIDWPSYRNDIVDFLDIDNRRNHAQAMFEVDITKLNEQIAKRPERMYSVTFQLAHVLYCYARAIQEHPEMQSRLYKKKLYLFDDVDISMIFEKTAPNGMKVPVPYVFRSAQKKTYTEILNELQWANEAEMHEIYKSKKSTWLRKLPKFLRMYLLKKTLSNPLKWKENLGTVAFTTLGMIIRNRRMYPVPIGPYSCMLAAGSSYHEKVDGKSVSKWCMVLNLDHNIIDGAPAVRFGKTFMALVEKGLPEE